MRSLIIAARGVSKKSFACKTRLWRMQLRGNRAAPLLLGRDLYHRVAMGTLPLLTCRCTADLHGTMAARADELDTRLRSCSCGRLQASCRCHRNRHNNAAMDTLAFLAGVGRRNSQPTSTLAAGQRESAGRRCLGRRRLWRLRWQIRGDQRRGGNLDFDLAMRTLALPPRQAIGCLNELPTSRAKETNHRKLSNGARLRR